MSDFFDIVKYLDLVAARKATLLEAQTGSYIPFDKYYSLAPSRAIKKVPLCYILKAHKVFVDYLQPLNRMVFQYNMPVPTIPFFILESQVLNDTPTPLGGFLALKYPSARYVLKFSDPVSRQARMRLYVANYPGNIIIPTINWTIEFWAFITHHLGPYPGYGVNKDMLIVTSLFRNPTTVDDLGDFVSVTAKDIADIGFTLPMSNPQNQPNIVWE